MKKTISFLMIFAILMTSCLMLSVSVFSEDEAPTPTGQELVMYVSDSGLDTNDGKTAEKPKKTLSATVNAMKTTIGNGQGQYNRGKIILCGDVTVDKSTVLGAHPAWALTVTSDDKANYKLILKQTLRMGGATLFTGIKIITATAGKFLWADNCNLTIGQAGIADDVITYDAAAGSVEALTVAGGFAGNSKQTADYTVTINCGTYKNLHTGEGTYGNVLNGSVTFIVNNATMTGGAISIGGIYKSGAGVAGVYECTGDYTLIINGGSYTNTNISIGWAGTYTGKNAVTLTDGSKVQTNEASKNVFGGDVLVDINGGTFTGDCKIGKGSSLDSEMSGELIFKKGLTIDISGIPYAEKETYKALVAPSEQAMLVEHELNQVTQVDENRHKRSCSCGCTNEVLEDHVWDTGVVTTAPTHTATGTKTYTCTVCKATKTEEIPASTDVHFYGEWEKCDATRHKRVCTDPSCDATEYEDHAWNEGVITTEPTHTVEGVKTYTCTVCGETKTEPVDKTPMHSMGDWEKHNETQHKRSCACGETKYADHTWDDGKITKAATSDAAGEKTYTCTVCGETRTEIVEKLPASTSGQTEKPEVAGCGSSLSSGAAVLVLSVLACVGIARLPKKKD